MANPHPTSPAPSSPGAAPAGGTSPGLRQPLHRCVDVATAARQYGVEGWLDGPPRIVRIADVSGDAAAPPLCDASHSTRFAVFALRVAAAIASVFVLLVGALAVTP